MTTFTIKTYTENVERMYKLFDGEKLSQLVSLRDAHVPDWSYLSDYSPHAIADVVQDSCGKKPIYKLIVGHLLCVKALYNKDYLEAYGQQNQCIKATLMLLNLTEQNWCLPLLHTVCLELRLLAEKTEASLKQSHGHVLEMCSEVILSCFKICAADPKSDEQTKKLAMLYLAIQLFKVYFRLNKIHLHEPLAKAIHDTGYELWEKFPLKQKITYKYFLGRIAMFSLKNRLADELLSYVFDACHGKTQKKLVLTYLIPVKMMLGYMPNVHLLGKYDLLQYLGLMVVIKDGDLKGFNEVMEEHESFFISAGIYFIVEQLKVIAFRNLFRKVYLARNDSEIAFIDLLAALRMKGHDYVNSDEVISILANLISERKLRGWMSYKLKKLFVCEHDPFPQLITI
ncbi:PCI domain-containing protein 2 homolog [Maniola jurtina]|uniref:PCI domain-containing protein 2 homolog n=1 Tax=Maniola jurtina TaxID=191418 RepID=UPI001E686F5C|nr:PCI domain-containing protein 2 homolog [Maniola jurtina]